MPWALNCLTDRSRRYSFPNRVKSFTRVRHLLQQLESNLTELRGGSDYTLRKIKIAAAHSLSLGLLPTIVKQMPTQFTYAVEAIDVDRAVDMLREGQSDFIFSYHDENLQQAPFDNIRLFESRLFPVCANNGRGEPRYTLEQPHFPCLITVRTPIWAD